MNTDKLTKILGEEPLSMSSVGGGCIADSQIISTRSGKKYFLKQGFSNGMFEKEANGLRELASADVIRVPEVIHTSKDCLIIEYIKNGSKKKDFFEYFGHKLALLHQRTAEGYGFFEDNFIGSTPQINLASEEEKNNWPLFYWNKRILYQFRLAEKNGYADKTLTSLISKLESVLEDILSAGAEPPALLHGDLWGGNYMVDESGSPVLIDPAVYYGHREADLAMTKLFGGFSEDFYRAYQQTYPLKAGASEREPAYLLYHVLNHLNLFGSGYYGQAIQLLRKLTKK
ncbi:fructosamine-3-kinase [Marinilabilia salmonicolor]|jgi:fructosamine-3-kinase|uniref:fructosamine kinase family protein n=1 Tax=Marinilabilia salmonicolor TaxID=989 RepID=UPI000D0632AA|nr:fructosamine kinase family protein [Marinilabilia salmonicolor]PRY95941.1 fructosamine-3-kinase [Marinilabilia salmonicolor]